MFKKAAVFTDIHLGMKGNSRIHNQDCEDFIDWYIQQSEENNCETGIFCGDWHHTRNSLNLTTMDSTIRCLEKLGKHFKNFGFVKENKKGKLYLTKEGMICHLLILMIGLLTISQNTQTIK